MTIHWELSHFTGECLAWSGIVLMSAVVILVILFLFAVWNRILEDIQTTYYATRNGRSFLLFTWYRVWKNNKSKIASFRKRAWQLMRRNNYGDSR